MDGIEIAVIGLLGTLIGTFLSKLSSDRTNYLTHITQERRDWRDAIRLIFSIRKQNFHLNISNNIL